MNARTADIRTYADMQCQLELERILARRRASETAAAASTPQVDSDPPLPRMIVCTVLVLAAWALFAWAGVAVVSAIGGAA